MGVNDIEVPTAIGAVKLLRGAAVRPRATGGEREELGLYIVKTPERLDLIADEAAVCGALPAWVHIGDDQGSHGLT